MLFQVLRNNTVMMSTDYEECIPPSNILRLMADAGYTVKKDNKQWKLPTQVKSKKKEPKHDES